jgi:hypothetical protein
MVIVMLIRQMLFTPNVMPPSYGAALHAVAASGIAQHGIGVIMTTCVVGVYIAGSHHKLARILIWQVFIILSIITLLCCLQLPCQTHHLQKLPLRSFQEISGVLSQRNIQ